MLYLYFSRDELHLRGGVGGITMDHMAASRFYMPLRRGVLEITKLMKI